MLSYFRIDLKRGPNPQPSAGASLLGTDAHRASVQKKALLNETQCSHFSTAVLSFAFNRLPSRAAIIPTFARFSFLKWLSKNSPRDGNDDELRTSGFDIQ